MATPILVVEDDEQLGAQIVSHLSEAGYAPRWFKDGDAALAADPNAYGLILLDLMLPGTYGLEVLKAIRKVSEVPVLILTARDHPADRVRGLTLGADDYVTKPFWPEELVARVKARLRRPAMGVANEKMSVGTLALDLNARQVMLGDKPLELTRVEFELLSALARRPGQAMTRRSLVDKALDPDRMGSERTLDVHISRLRKKLGAEGKRIATVWGIGYRLKIDVPGEADESR